METGIILRYYYRFHLENQKKMTALLYLHLISGISPRVEEEEEEEGQPQLTTE